MGETLQQIVDGSADESDIELLVEIGQAVRAGALCGLGKTAPNPVLSTLAHFRAEYVAHAVDKRCPTGVCQGLKTYEISAEACRGCTKCAKVCPVNAITGQPKSVYTIDPQLCIKCGVCVESCKFAAIKEVS